jgi:hypothetical protein
VRDPHVQILRYELAPGEKISYSDPEPLIRAHNLCNIELRDGKLTITPIEHFANEDEARKAIEPFLKAWEIKSDLKYNMGMIRFKFVRAEVIDRDPPPPGTPVAVPVKLLSASLTCHGEVSFVNVTFKKYPEPPKDFCISLDVETAYRRWINYRNGKESLQNMAYFILDLLQSIAVGRKNAATTFQIDIKILDKIGELSSTKGTAVTARKVKGNTSFQELTSPEMAWLEESVRRVILRIGERASGAPLTPIRLSDLPDSDNS